jgi:hypothetical protein
MRRVPAQRPALTAIYKATIRLERELPLQHSSRPDKLPVRYDKMTFPCSTSFEAPPIAAKFVPYIPRAKPKPTPKAKPIAATKTAKHSRPGIDSKDSGEWFRIDDECTIPDSNASQPTLYEATNASPLVDYDESCSMMVTSQRNPTGTGLVGAFAGFRGGCELENPEHVQLGEELLDEGRLNHPVRVAERDPAMIGLLGRVSRGKHASE